MLMGKVDENAAGRDAVDLLHNGDSKEKKD